MRSESAIPTQAPAEAQITPRNAGLILSFVFHLSIFMIMANGTLRRFEADPPSAPIRVELNPEPEPTPEPFELDIVNPAPAQPQMAPATTAEDDQPDDPDAVPDGRDAESAGPVAGTKPSALAEPVVGDSLAAPSSGDPAEAAEQVPASEPTMELPLDPARPRTRTARERAEEEEAFARSLSGGAASAVKAVNAQADGGGSRKVADRLQAATVHQKAKKWLTTTKGANEGIIRSMDISDVPPSVAEDVLGRLGISIMIKRLNEPEGGGYNFLNQARTSAGTYTSSAGSGVFQVFTYSQAAVSRMMQLELEEMRRRGFDPEKSRIVQVEFGIVNTTKGYQLGIRSIEIVPIPPEEGAP